MTALFYGLHEDKIPQIRQNLRFGEVMIASHESKGGLESIDQSKGKKITSISGGNRKLFIFEEKNESQNVVTALHAEEADYLEYQGQTVLPIHEIIIALEGNTISQIRCGKEHHMILTGQGLIYTFGKGNFGSLGLGGCIFAPGPRLVTKLSNKKIVSVACGMYHSLALSDIGDVFSWGRGFQGQLGLLKDVDSVASPHLIPHFFKYDKSKEIKTLKKNPIHFVACGAYHSIAIDQSGSIYCWGEARYGQTGAGKKTKEPVPTLIPINADGVTKKVVSASGGFGHTLCLTSEGEIFSWGLNVKGQLGLNDLPENMKMTQKEMAYTKASYTPVQIKLSRDKTPLPKFTEISCGFCSSYAIDEVGHAWSWGGGNLGFLGKHIERGPVKLTEGTQNRIFSKVFANEDSVMFFSSLLPLFFKPTLAPSRGLTEVTFFGNGFTHTGNQCARLTFSGEQLVIPLEYEERTSTFYCQTPVFEKISKKISFPTACKVQISLDGKQFLAYDKPLIIYSSKLQMQSIEPQSGPALGNCDMRIYMPLDELTQSSLGVISVGFKNNNTNEENRFQDWTCAEGVYKDDFITCRIPNLPHFDAQNPFHVVDVSLNGQQFTEYPQTFRYYLINQASIIPHQGQDNDEKQILLSGKGFFDAPGKQLLLSLQFSYKEQDYHCSRSVDLKWNKAERNFTFKMPKLQWLIGDHECTPELLNAARTSSVSVVLRISKVDSIEIGKYTFVLPPPPPEPEEDKKDAKKDAKKAGKK